MERRHAVSLVWFLRLDGGLGYPRSLLFGGMVVWDVPVLYLPGEMVGFRCPGSWLPYWYGGLGLSQVPAPKV